MTPAFYRAFEDCHRGSRELIGKRLEIYLPFVAPLRELYSPARVVDLGCGRGEWLELVSHVGFEAHGVDLDEHMLRACRELKLSVQQGEALQHLQKLDDASHCVVSGFHFAEHISFDDLEALVIEALRVLEPAGLLILETPNPENLVVGTSSFWLDPTHQRPLPPPLLSFLAEHAGFARVKLLRLQEPADLGARSDIRLSDVITGASPDYSIVAQKGADSELLGRFDAAFASDYGIDSVTLADRFDRSIVSGMTDLEQRV
ncbi:MAG: class I SAM-dependent methyltransferase, partial [Burkholderiales bacterium]